MARRGGLARRLTGTILVMSGFPFSFLNGLLSSKANPDPFGQANVNGLGPQAVPLSKAGCAGYHDQYRQVLGRACLSSHMVGLRPEFDRASWLAPSYHIDGIFQTHGVGKLCWWAMEMLNGANSKVH